MARFVLLTTLCQVDRQNCLRVDQLDLTVLDMSDKPNYTCILDGVQFCDIQMNTNQSSLKSIGQSVAASQTQSQQEDPAVVKPELTL